MNKIASELMGGIGNQLFQYFAGLHFSRKFSSEFELVQPITALHRTEHKNSEIQDFQFSVETALSRDHFFSKHLMLNKAVFWISRRSRISANLVAIFGYITDDNLSKINETKFKSNSIYLKGYFQTCRYFLELDDYDRKVELRNPSPWFKGLLAEIHNHPHLAIHVRRGDYTAPGNVMGLLGEEYYKNALNRFEQNKFKIFVFTDDINSAKDLLMPILGNAAIYVAPPSGTPAAESLMLMSKCNAIITANSTFSYWAALLSTTAAKIVYPYPWFEGEGYLVPTVPDSWTPIKSYFTN
jgi:hypothetical protein